MTRINAFGEVRSSPPGARLSGILAITLAVALLSLSDSVVKLLGDRLALGQLVCLRSVAAGFLLALACSASSRSGLRPRRPGWVTARSLCLAAMWFLYYASLPVLPFAVAAAGFYTAPLWMALMARAWLGRRLGRAGWGALGLGLAGVAVVLRPGAGMASAWFALPLGAALCYALAALLTETRLRDEAALTMAFNLNAVLAVAGAAWVAGLGLVHPGGTGFVLAQWREVTREDAILIGLLAVLLAVIATLVARAYQSAPAPLVGMFDNAYLAFAVLWGALLFGTAPGPAEAAGIALIGLGSLLMSRAG